MDEEKCTCDDSYEFHICPYQLEINGDDSESCDCCEECEQQCRDDI